MIEGGYYIKARCIQESEIAQAAPCVREIWDWLIKEANHKDTKICKRGQCVRTYRDIQEGLAWYVGWRKMTYKKHDCENTMKWLKKTDMITTTKTTRGMLITVLNYNKYQDPKNYENHTTADTKATRKPQTTDTINKNDKNDKKERGDNSVETVEKIAYGEMKKVKLSDVEKKKLKEKYGSGPARDLVNELDTYIASTGKRYKSHYATLLNWAKRKGLEPLKQYPKQDPETNISPEQEKKNKTKLAEIRKNLNIKLKVKS